LATSSPPGNGDRTGPAGGTAATVEFERVTKRYDGRAGAPAAVADLTFAVPAGKICVLVGPSGCGKTTSLKMVNRLVEPTSGRVLIDGVDLATRDVTELRRSIGYVIQQVGLFPHQTIAQNVMVVPSLLGWPEPRRRERTNELLALVGLDPERYGDRYPAQLSGGERQRVGVARALAADPPVMLMDEPFGAVDPIQRMRLQDEFLRLQRGLAKTILFVTHDIDEAIKMGDLVAVMEQGGHLAQFAPPSELLSRPATEFVARFVGTDRGLKRLSLARVGDLTVREVATAVVDEDVADVLRRSADDDFPYLLLVDRDQRPVGWVKRADLPGQGRLDRSAATPMSPLLVSETTVKDALSLMLDADVQAGIVVDADGRAGGMITVAAIGGLLRDDGPGPTQAGP
jgi:osmoprotectant transport system ATP-binding protein